MIDFWSIPPREEIFTHVEHGVQTMFAATQLYAYCVAHQMPMGLIPVIAEDAEYFLHNRGVEQYRLDRLRPEDFAKPILMIRWDAESHLMVDGTHRYVRLAQLGVKECLAYVVDDRAVWEQFVITNAPVMSQDMMTGYSGM